MDERVAKLLSLQRTQLDRLTEAQARKLVETLRRTRQDLRDRLDRTSKGSARFTPIQTEAVLAQVSLAVVDLERRLKVLSAEAATAAYDLAAAHVTEKITAFAAATGFEPPPLQIEAAVALQDELLLQRHATGIATYGAELVARAQDAMSSAALEGVSWAEMERRLVGVDGLFAQDYFGGFARDTNRQSRAERVVRTEMAHAYNRAHLLDAAKLDEADPGYLKQLVSTFDDRTGADSIRVNGQIRELDRPFNDGHHNYMHPPNRPNDREVVVLVRPEWIAEGLTAVDAATDPESQAAVAKATKRAAEAGTPPKKARKASQVNPAPTRQRTRPRGPKFPKSPEGKLVRRLGGSTGADLIEVNGRQYVRKRGASAEHLLEEARVDELYRSLGVRVPESKIYETADGPVKLAEYIENAVSLSDAARDPKLAQRITDQTIADIRAGHVADAWVGNWDVYGLASDNILVDAQGQAWRVDNGGALRFRAQGQRKTVSEWDEEPNEVWSLRERNRSNPIVVRALDGLSIDEIRDQCRTISTKVRRDRRLQKLLSELPDELAITLQGRAATLGKYAEVIDTLRKDGFDAAYVDDFLRHYANLRKRGIVRAARHDWTVEAEWIRAYGAGGEPLTIKAHSVTPVDENGKPFDELRGENSVTSRVANYMRDQGLLPEALDAWARAQTGSSWSQSSIGIKHFFTTVARKSEGYYWPKAISRDSSRVAWDIWNRDVAAGRGADLVAAHHAFTFSMLDGASFKGRGFPKRKAGFHTYWRVEPHAAFARQLELGEVVVPGDGLMERGPVESFSVFKPKPVYGQVITRQEIADHRVFGLYFQQKYSGNQSLFGGDEENEAVVITDEIPFKVHGAISREVGRALVRRPRSPGKSH